MKSKFPEVEVYQALEPLCVMTEMNGAEEFENGIEVKMVTFPWIIVIV